MEASEAIFSAVQSTIKGDTGAGVGLLDSTAAFAGFVRGPVFLLGDTTATSPNDVPYIPIDVVTQDKSPFPTPASGTCEFFVGEVTLWLVDDRDQRAGVSGRIFRTAARARTIFQNATMTAFVDIDDNSRKWYFNPASRTSLGRAVYDDEEVRVPLSFRVYASKGTA